MKKRILRHSQRDHPLSRIPPEYKKLMQDILHNREIISVYSDYSGNLEHPIMGVGACIVGDSSTEIRSKKYYTDLAQNTIYGEITAVAFSLASLPKLMDKYKRLMNKPTKVIIYTDCLIFIESYETNSDPINQALAEVEKQKQAFLQYCSWIELSFKFIGEAKKYNIYYKAAHNASRRAIAKK